MDTDCRCTMMTPDRDRPVVVLRVVDLGGGPLRDVRGTCVCGGTVEWTEAAAPLVVRMMRPTKENRT